MVAWEGTPGRARRGGPDGRRAGWTVCGGGTHRSALRRRRRNSRSAALPQRETASSYACACGGGASQAPQQVRPHRVVDVQPLEPQGVHRRERDRRTLDLRERDGTVQRHDRGRRDREQVVVEREDLRPVRRGDVRAVRVHRLDRGLELVRARPPAAQAPPHELEPLRDERRVPRRPVLLGQRDEGPVGRDPGGPARVHEQHEREQPHDLLVVGHELHEEPPEPDRLRAQVRAHEALAGARGVPLGEHEVHDREDRPETSGELGVTRDPVGDARVADLALGAHEALRHRRLLDEERAGDLGGREPTHHAQRERDARRGRERRVAAREDEAQPVVVHGALLDGVVRCVQERGLRVAVRARGLAADPVDRLAARGREDPAGRAGGQAGHGPALDGRGERLLHRVLGEVQVAEDAGQDGDGTRVLRAEHALDVRRADRGHGRVSRPARTGTGAPRSAARRPAPCGDPSRGRRRGRARR